MLNRPDYKGFIEDHFNIKTKEGVLTPFKFNEVQDLYYSLLLKDYPLMKGLRENILKGRQQGFSSLIDGFLTTDFLLSAQKLLPIISGQIISHKKEETKPLFDRVNLYIESWLDKQTQLNSLPMIKKRKWLLAEDNTSRTSMYLRTHTGAELYVGTAGAATLGRGGTLQNYHWSEVGFYPDTENKSVSELVTGAEQQILDGIGMIFRESTGNMEDDFFYNEFFLGLEPETVFTSRFFEWWLTSEYIVPLPKGYKFSARENELVQRYNLETKMKSFNWSIEQFNWYIKKLVSSQDPREIVREYPCTAEEAFMGQGERYFDTDALNFYRLEKQLEPIKTGELVYA